MDEMSESGYAGKNVGEAAARASVFVRAFQYAHPVGEVFAEVKHCAYAGCEVRRVRLEFSRFKRRLKCRSSFEEAAHRIGLVAVCDDEAIADLSHGAVDYERGVRHLGFVERVYRHGLAVRSEHAVAAVPAPSHYEIRKRRVSSVFRKSCDDPASGIRALCKYISDIFLFVNVHYISSVFGAASFPRPRGAAAEAAERSGAAGFRIFSALFIAPERTVYRAPRAVRITRSPLPLPFLQRQAGELYVQPRA